MLFRSRGYQVYAIAAPDGEDKTHHYLWRFWRRLKSPDEKQILIFDRSWYGRVMVERVEGFATEEEWKRAYREINEFERQLVDAGIIIVKFWVHISRDEQRQRFEHRRETAHKSWKLTEEDWRNREKWDDYACAVDLQDPGLFRPATGLQCQALGPAQPRGHDLSLEGRWRAAVHARDIGAFGAVGRG